MTPSKADREKAREAMRKGLPLGELDNLKDSRKLLDVIAQALANQREEDAKLFPCTMPLSCKKVHRCMNCVYASAIRRGGA